MPVVTDTFPAPVLNSSRWFSFGINDGAISVGSPTDGIYPQNLDADGDAVYISSSEKMIVPGVLGFNAQIFYDDVYTVPEMNIVSFFSWYSIQLDVVNEPAYSLSLLLCAKPTPEYIFQQVVRNQGAVYRTDIVADPTSGANGGFRIERIGMNYHMYYYDIGLTQWVLLATEAVPHVGPGYIVFGQFAESTDQQGFPWVFQT